MKRPVKRGARLGQHFLKNKLYAALLAKSAATRPDDTILEIGPGKGVLTKELLATGCRVIAIEKDHELVSFLRTEFHTDLATGQLTVIEQDIRNFNPATISGAYTVAANIPYYITGEIIRHFLTNAHQPRAMALLMQKEVAERIVSRDKKESILSLSVKAYGQPKIIAKVSKGNFSPPPQVDSAILLVNDISKAFFSDFSEEHFFEVVRAGFSSKRKLLANNLRALFGEDTEHVLRRCGIPEQARAESLTLYQWQKISEQK